MDLNTQDRIIQDARARGDTEEAVNRREVSKAFARNPPCQDCGGPTVFQQGRPREADTNYPAQPAAWRCLMCGETTPIE